MENCLVTKLKAVVNNDSLSYMNAVRIKVKGSVENPTNINLALTFNSGLIVKILSAPTGVYLSNEVEGTNYGTEHEYLGGNIFLRGNLGNDWIEVLVKSKDKLKGLSSNAYRYFDIDLKELAYCSNLTTINARSLPNNVIRGSVSNLKTTAIQELVLPSNQTGITLSELAELTTLKTLGLSYSSTTGVLTDIAAVDLEAIYLQGTPITGDWKDYVAARRLRSVTGTMGIRPGENTRFNGQAFGEWVNSVLVWDANSIIIKGNENHKAYTYNITEEQRTALQNEGYTTIVAVD